MPNKYLLPIYRYLFDEPFCYGEFSKRLKMQKAVYLLQEMGVPISDYGFSWYKHGPYSQALLDDTHQLGSDTQRECLPPLSTDNKKAIDKLKEALVVPEGSIYSDAEWSECLASLLFLKQNVLSRKSTGDDLINALTTRKHHLSEQKTNREALSRIEQLFL